MFWNKCFPALSKIIVIVFGILTFLSVFLYAYTSFYGRPTGDDLGFSYRAHRAWEETNSIKDVLDATIEEISIQRDECASDFTMVFFVSVMPEVFKPWTFWVGCWFILFSLIVSIFLFSHEILVNRFHFSKWVSFFFGCLCIFVILQQMPSTNSGMYWYTGAIHYPFAFSLALLFVVCTSKYLEKGRKINLIFLCLLAVLIGGDGYFATVLLVTSFFFLLVYGIIHKKKRVFHLVFPMVILLSCCLICMTGEGPSKIRANGQLSFSASLALKAILNSILRSVKCAFLWIGSKFFIVPCIIAEIWVLFYGIKWEDVRFEFPKPMLVLGSLFLMYAAVYSPWVYSEYFDEFGASMGPENFCFFTFVFWLFLSVLYVFGYFRKKHAKKVFSFAERMVGIGLVGVCLFCIFINRHAIKDTHGYVGTEYILSGQADDYKEQCRQNMELLLDTNVRSVELIPTSDSQGLLCNMVPTENSWDFTSLVYAQFYGKESAVAKSR